MVRFLSQLSWVIVAVVFCGVSGRLRASAEAFASVAPDPAQEAKDQTEAPATASNPAKKSSGDKKTASGKSAATRKPPSPSRHHPVSARQRRGVSPRVRRMRQAFVASASLRPMAQQLLQDRTLPAYAGVQAYARTHSKEDAGALAWLVLGYAHVLDKDYAKAIDPLSRAKIHAGDLGDYVAYYLGVSYLQTGHTAEALATLADFAKTHPDSLLVRDARLSYSRGLLAEGQAAEAAVLLEQNRTHVRSDVDLALGRSYAAAGQSAKAAEVSENIYYTMA